MTFVTPAVRMYGIGVNGVNCIRSLLASKGISTFTINIVMTEDGQVYGVAATESGIGKLRGVVDELGFDVLFANAARLDRASGLADTIADLFGEDAITDWVPVPEIEAAFVTLAPGRTLRMRP